MEKLDINSILDVDAESLFDDYAEEETQSTEETNNINPEITEVNPDNLFDKPEIVGNEETDNQDEVDPVDKGNGSPKTNFYSSIAKALKEDGVLLSLEEDDINKVKSPEDFAEIIEKQIQAKLDERQRRIDEALNLGVEPEEIKVYENTISYLNNITDESINDESDKGEGLRKQLIYQDFINRGYSKERAQREVTKSFNAGTDIDDAKEALNSNKEFFTSEYKDMLKEAKEEQSNRESELAKQSETLKKSILEDKQILGDLNIDKSTRNKIFENISKPVYKDPKSGEVLTTIQKYERENKTDFIKNVGILYTLTDGFKNIDKLVKPKVNKELKKGISQLESVINNTSRTNDGNLNFVSGINDEESAFKGWTIDVK